MSELYSDQGCHAPGATSTDGLRERRKTVAHGPASHQGFDAGPVGRRLAVSGFNATGWLVSIGLQPPPPLMPPDAPS